MFLPRANKAFTLPLLLCLLSVSVLLGAPRLARAGGEEPPPPEPAAAALAVEGRHFVDEQGRVVILRGVNVAGDSKVPPFRGITDLSELDPLPGLGVNVIRLLFTWEAYEPFPGQYDEGYLDHLAQVAEAAWQRGMFVIVDFHQDVYSRFLSGGCGDGFPGWAISPEASPDEPDNGPGCADWMLQGTFDPDMHLSWSEFFADTNGVRTRYLMMWERLAQRFSSNPGVIGYDPLNEPWGWEIAELAPLYEDAALAIRAYHPSAIVFVEPHVIVGSIVPLLGAAVDVAAFFVDPNLALLDEVLQTTLPKPTFGNFAYAPHFYDPTIVVLKAWLSGGWFTDIAFEKMTEKAGQWNVPLFLGEFGAPVGTWLGPEFLDLQYKRLNENLASGAQWGYTPGWTAEEKDGWNQEDFSIVDDQGALRDNFEIRPSAQRVAGTPTELTVTDNGKEIELKWSHNPAAGATEIFVPKQTLFGSKQVKIEKEGSGLSCSFDAAQTHVSCTSNDSGAKRVKVRECVMIWGTCY